MNKLLEAVMALALAVELRDTDRMEKCAVSIGLAWGTSRKTVPPIAHARCLVGAKTNHETAEHLAVLVIRAAQITCGIKNQAS